MPMKQRTIWPKVNLSERDRQQLLDLMQQVVVDTPSVRDAFDFANSRLIGRIDARRGESEFFLAEFMEENLLACGYELDREDSIGEMDTYFDYSHGDMASTNHLIRRTYIGACSAVDIVIEVSDRGRHRHITVSFFQTEHRLFM